MHSLHQNDAQAPKNKNITTYCRISGFPLFTSPAIFPSEKLHFSTHWIFSYNFAALERLEQKCNKARWNTEQRSLLALAFILQDTALGSKIHVKHPILFQPVALKRNYHQVAFIANYLHNLLPAQRHKLLSNFPVFNTEKIAGKQKGELVNPTGEEYAKKLTAIAPAFWNYIENIYVTIKHEVGLGIGYNSDLETAILDYQEKHSLQRSLDRQLLAARANDAGSLGDYWEYILSELQEQFEFTSKQIQHFASELHKPTSSCVLGELKKYIQVLQETVGIGGNTVYNIPAKQFDHAIAAITEIQLKLETTENSLARDINKAFNSLVNADDTNAFSCISTQSEKDGIQNFEIVLNLTPKEEAQAVPVDLTTTDNVFSPARIAAATGNYLEQAKQRHDALIIKKEEAEEQARQAKVSSFLAKFNAAKQKS